MTSVRATSVPTGSNSDDAQPGRVLYVEDNPANVSLMEDVFRLLPGTELQTARSAEDGLELIRGNPPDLVLTDISLPGMSGLELMKLIKAGPRTATIPVVAISASAMPRDVQAGLDAGFQAYFTKPIDVIEIMAFIEKILQRDEQA
jgi:CheY-like chemotaxis protein